MLIIRKAIDQEDEGLCRVVRAVRSLEEAQEWVKGQAGQYYGPECYLLVLEE